MDRKKKNNNTAFFFCKHLALFYYFPHVSHFTALDNSGWLLFVCCLLLVATAAPATTRPLELTSLRAYQRFGVRVWHTRSRAEVSYGLTLFAWSLDEHGLATSWRFQSQLIECNDLTTGLQDAATCFLCDAECAYLCEEKYV